MIHTVSFFARVPGRAGDVFNNTDNYVDCSIYIRAVTSARSSGDRTGIAVFSRCRAVGRTPSPVSKSDEAA